MRFNQPKSVRSCAFAAALVAVWGLAGCERKAATPAAPDPTARDGISQGYLTSPSLTRVSVGGGRLELSGAAPPGAQVRIAAPGGDALSVAADDKGAWTLVLPQPAAPRIFGLSMTAAGRRVQAEGYILVTPTGQAALLRAGAGAQRVDALPAAAIGAVDTDQAGTSIVSGSAPAGAPLSVRLDGRQAVEGRADSRGRFSIALTQPMTAGAHKLEVFGEGFSDQAQVDATRAEPLADGPLRSQVGAGGLRVDWMTPGGGVQSTLIVD